MDGITQKTLEIVEKIKTQQTASKAYNTALNLLWYDLEPAAKLLFPVITPLRNMIPRVAADGGNATNWKAITGINTTKFNAGVSEGNRGPAIVSTEQDYTAPYRGIGLEDFETWEAEYGSKNFDNLRALMGQNLLYATMIQEELITLGGNGSDGIALGTPATPTGVAVNAGGTIPATATNQCVVVALTLDGFNLSTVAGGVATSSVRTNADGSTDTVNGGSSNKSATAANVTTTGGASLINWAVTAVKGASAYAWFTGSGGTFSLCGITTTNTFQQLAPATGTQVSTAITADLSKNALVFSGIISQALNAVTGTGYFASLNGATLTSDNSGGIVEIDAALRDRWDNYRVSPTKILVNSQELLNITKKVIAGGASPLFRFTVDGASGNPGSVDRLTLTAGTVIGTYLNKFTMAGGQMIPVMLHPNVPPGMIIFISDTPPYAISRIRNVMQYKVRKEYYQIEWPYKSRKYEAGVYCDELLQVYAPFMFGVICNILNG